MMMMMMMTMTAATTMMMMMMMKHSYKFTQYRSTHHESTQNSLYKLGPFFEDESVLFIIEDSYSRNENIRVVQKDKFVTKVSHLWELIFKES